MTEKLIEKFCKFKNCDKEHALDFVSNVLRMPVIGNSDTQKKDVLLNARNVILINEMKQIQNRFESCGFSFAFIKGLYEAYDLYNEPITRLSCDIDILISINHIKSAVHILRNEMGYTSDIDFDQNLAILDEQIENDSIHHICSISKPILNGLFKVSIELHKVLDVMWNRTRRQDKVDISEVMLHNSTKNSFYNQKIYTLDIEDRLIVSMQHFARHLLSEITEFTTCENGCLFNCKTLLDAILIYQKYHKKIDFETLYRRIEYYNFKYLIIVANKFVEMLFGVKILNYDKLEKMRFSTYNYWHQCFLLALNSALTYDFLFAEDITLYYKEVVKRCIDQNLYYNCKPFYDSVIAIDDTLPTITKVRFGTIYREDLYPAEKDRCKAFIRMKWDAEFLYIECKVYDKTIKYYGKNQKNKWSDAVTVSIYNPDFSLEEKNSVIGLMFNPAIDDSGKKHVLISCCYCSDSDKRIGDISEILERNCEFGTFEEGYIMHLKLDWSSLNIKIDNIDFIGMDFAINNVNSDDAKIDSVICWSNPTKSYYCPAKFGKVYIRNHRF